MQLLGLLRFTHAILPACNYGHWHLELSVDLSEAEGCRDHERRFGRGSPDLRWAHRHLFRKAPASPPRPSSGIHDKRALDLRKDIGPNAPASS